MQRLQLTHEHVVVLLELFDRRAERVIDEAPLEVGLLFDEARDKRRVDTQGQDAARKIAHGRLKATVYVKRALGVHVQKSVRAYELALDAAHAVEQVVDE